MFKKKIGQGEKAGIPQRERKKKRRGRKKRFYDYYSTLRTGKKARACAQESAREKEKERE